MLYRKKTLQKWGIALFLLLHVFAIGIEAIPRSARLLPGDIRRMFRPIFLPYILSTGQWQTWSLFAPDPEHRDISWRIIDDRTKATIESIDAGTVSWTRRATLLKAIRMLTDTKSPELHASFVQSYCRGREPDDVLRLVVSIRSILTQETHIDDSLTVRCS